MSRFIATFKLTPAYFQATLKDPGNREAVLKPLFERIGGTLEHLYVSPDTMEGFEIWTIENPAALDGLLLTVAATGIVDPSTWSIRRLLTGPELEATARAADPSLYRPPGA